MAGVADVQQAYLETHGALIESTLSEAVNDCIYRVASDPVAFIIRYLQAAQQQKHQRQQEEQPRAPLVAQTSSLVAFVMRPTGFTGLSSRTATGGFFRGQHVAETNRIASHAADVALFSAPANARSWRLQAAHVHAAPPSWLPHYCSHDTAHLEFGWQQRLGVVANQQRALSPAELLRCVERRGKKVTEAQKATEAKRQRERLEAVLHLFDEGGRLKPPPKAAVDSNTKAFPLAMARITDDRWRAAVAPKLLGEELQWESTPSQPSSLRAWLHSGDERAMEGEGGAGSTNAAALSASEAEDQVELGQHDLRIVAAVEGASQQVALSLSRIGFGSSVKELSAIRLAPTTVRRVLEALGLLLGDTSVTDALRRRTLMEQRQAALRERATGASEEEQRTLRSSLRDEEQAQTAALWGILKASLLKGGGLRARLETFDVSAVADATLRTLSSEYGPDSGADSGWAGGGSGAERALTVGEAFKSSSCAGEVLTWLQSSLALSGALKRRDALASLATATKSPPPPQHLRSPQSSLAAVVCDALARLQHSLLWRGQSASDAAVAWQQKDAPSAAALAWVSSASFVADLHACEACVVMVCEAADDDQTWQALAAVEAHADAADSVATEAASKATDSPFVPSVLCALVQWMAGVSLGVRFGGSVRSGEAADVAALAESVEELRDEYNVLMAEATRAVAETVAAVERGWNGSISQLRSMPQPAQGTQLTLSAVGILLGVAVDMEEDEASGCEHTWEAVSKAVLSRADLHKALTKYEKETITPAMLAKLEPICRRASFTPDAMGSKHVALKVLCAWVRSLYTYGKLYHRHTAKRGQVSALQLEFNLRVFGVDKVKVAAVALPELDFTGAGLELRPWGVVKADEPTRAQQRVYRSRGKLYGDRTGGFDSVPEAERRKHAEARGAWAWLAPSGAHGPYSRPSGTKALALEERSMRLTVPEARRVVPWLQPNDAPLGPEQRQRDREAARAMHDALAAKAEGEGWVVLPNQRSWGAPGWRGGSTRLGAVAGEWLLDPPAWMAREAARSAKEAAAQAANEAEKKRRVAKAVVEAAEKEAAKEKEAAAVEAEKRKRREAEEAATAKQARDEQAGFEEMVEEEMEERKQEEQATARGEGGGGAGGACEGGWTTASWVESLSLHDVVAAALMPLMTNSGSGEAAFFQLASLDYAALKGRLAEAQLSGLSTHLWRAIETLKHQSASTGASLHSKFVGEASFTFAFGGLDLFFGGLESLIGAPSTSKPADGVGPPTLLNTMRSEHCSQSDANLPFSTANGIEGATSALEWEFVVEPKGGFDYVERGGDFRVRSPELCRVVKPLAVFHGKMRRLNERLAAKGHVPLITEELVGGRLYTGPLYVKYNTILRSYSGDEGQCKKLLVLGCGEWVEEAGAEGGEGGGKKSVDDPRWRWLNKYTTTIHAINSYVLKAAKLTRVAQLWRGFAGGVLPRSFWEADEDGIRGGIEYGFSSTTTQRAQAVHYSQGKASLIFEMRMGMIDRGASVVWLSQYPHEREMLFPPLLGMEALRSHVQGRMLVVEVALSNNLNSLTLEQVVSKRRKVCLDMLSSMQTELTQTLKQPRWEPPGWLSSLKDDAHGAISSVRSHLLDVDAATFNDDDYLAAAVGGVVRASRAVSNWPEKLAQMCWPAMQASARDALQSITKSNLGQLKCLSKPPRPVKVCLTCVALLIAPSANWMESAATDEGDEGWAWVKPVLGHPRFLSRVINTSLETPPPALYRAMRLLHDPDFTYSNIKKVSVAAAGFCLWCRSFLVLQRLRVWLDEHKVQEAATAQEELSGAGGGPLAQNGLTEAALDAAADIAPIVLLARSALKEEELPEHELRVAAREGTPEAIDRAILAFMRMEVTQAERERVVSQLAWR